MDKRQVVNAIKRFVEKTYLDPEPNNRKDLLVYRSYRKWAVGAVIKEIEKYPNIPASSVIERFIREMDDYSCRKNPSSVIFSIARDVAMDLLDTVLMID